MSASQRRLSHEAFPDDPFRPDPHLTPGAVLTKDLTVMVTMEHTP
jgi:hypothetical protein